MMERIIINGNLYRLPNGTKKAIDAVWHSCEEKATAKEHEDGTAYDVYNQFLQFIIDTQKSVFVHGAFETNY